MPGFLLRGRDAPARGVFVRIQTKERKPCSFKKAKAEIPPAGRAGAQPEAADIAKVVDIYVRALATQGFEERLVKLERGGARASMPADA